MRHVSGRLGRAGSDDCRSRRALKSQKGLNFKPRLTEIEDISKAKRTMTMTHVAPDAVCVDRQSP
jgi:hypothetical protein